MKFTAKMFLCAIIAQPLLPTASALTPTGSRTDFVRLVAITNQQAPGYPAGVVFRNSGGGSGFFEPTINDLGQIAFIGQLAGPNINSSNFNGLWLETYGSFRRIAQQSQPIPGGLPGQLFQFPDHPQLNNAGQMAFEFSITGTNVVLANDKALWLTHALAPQLVAREGMQAPGAPIGTTFDEADLSESLVLNDAGQLAFMVRLRDGSGSPSLSGIWANRGAGLQPVAFGGMQAPNHPTGVTFSSASYPVLSANGQIAFSGNLSGPGFDADNSDGMWIDSGGTLTRVMQEGAPIPMIPGATFGDVKNQFSINSQGEISFPSDLNIGTTSLDALWTTAGGNLQLVAQQGGQAAGLASGITYGSNSFQSAVLNNRGQMAFGGFLTGASQGVNSTNNSAVWAWDNGVATLLAREGDQVPDLPSGVLFAGIGRELMINDNGQVAFRADLKGTGVTNSNNFAIMATDAQGQLHTLLRLGDLIDYGSSGLLPVSAMFFFKEAGSGDGRRTAFNNLGQFTLSFLINGGSAGGILVSDFVAVPEPCSVALTITLAVSFAACRTRRRL
jgi:hypothetical protein